MSLYQLPLPPQELIPFAIPEHIHPLFVHFAIALPIVILVIELYNLIAKRRAIAVLSLFFMVLLAIVIFGAILTGATDAKLANTTDGVKDIILEHKAIATYLLYGVGVLIILKLLSMFVARNLFKVAYVIFTFIFIAVTFYDGKLGGSLVYEYGVNVKFEKIPTLEPNLINKSNEAKEEHPKKEDSLESIDSNSTQQDNKEQENEIKESENNTSLMQEGNSSEHKEVESNITEDNHTQKIIINEKNVTLEAKGEENVSVNETNSTH